MRAEIKFSSKRFLMSLTLCACSVILLQSFDLAPASFLFDLLCVGVGLGLCFLLFLPTALLKKRCGGDTLSQLGSRSAAERRAVAAVYCAYAIFAALYFLLPYTDMFCKKYYTETDPCFVAFMLLICCVYAAFKGANVITRFAVFLFALAMVTNLLLFGGSLSSLRFDEDSFRFEGGIQAFFRNTGYFFTPGFIAVLFACLSGYTRNFRLRQPVVALALTGLKFALILFFIAFAVGEYASRQEYQTFLLSRVAHFGSYAGVESFYMALSTMSVFMIVSLFLCAICRAVGRNGSLPWIAGFSAAIFLLRFAAEAFSPLRTVFTDPTVFNALTVLTGAVIPMYYYLKARRQNG